MWEMCKDIQQELVAMRRDLHKIPEFGSQLPKTRAYIIDKLNEWGIPYVENKTDSGLTATIKGGKEGKTIAFRADMDALLIKEGTGVDVQSYCQSTNTVDFAQLLRSKAASSFLPVV